MSDINVSFGANTAGVQQALALVKQTVNQTSVDMRQTFTTVNKSVTNVNTTLNEANNKFVTINKTVGEFKASMLAPPPPRARLALRAHSRRDASLQAQLHRVELDA